MNKKILNLRSFTNLIKIQDLRMIIALDEHGTILNAATIMGLSQPAITKRLQDLEKNLEITLFHRMSRGVEPTPYGEIIIKHAHIVLNQLRSAEGEISDLFSGLGGRLTVGIPVSSATSFVSQAIVELLEKRENVQITLVEDYNIRLIPSLKRGNLDLIVGRLPNKTQYDDISIESFYKESLQLVVRKEHPLANQKSIKPADLHSSGWLMPPQTSIIYSQIENYFRQREMAMPKASIYSLSHSISLNVLKNRNLIAALPKESTAKEVSNGDLKVLDLNFAEESIHIGIITRQSGFNSPAAQMFMEIIREIGTKN